MKPNVNYKGCNRSLLHLVLHNICVQISCIVNHLFFIDALLLVRSYYLRPKIIIALSIFFLTFDHSSYLKKYKIIIFFIYDLLCYQ